MRVHPVQVYQAKAQAVQEFMGKQVPGSEFMGKLPGKMEKEFTGRVLHRGVSGVTAPAVPALLA